MKKLSLIAICILGIMFDSCKKEDEQPKVHDFHYLITKDVHWTFHFQGQIKSVPGPIQFDTSYHRYVTAGPTGDTAMVNGNVAYYYYLKADNYRAGQYEDSDSGIVLLREDLEDKQVYMLRYYPGIWVAGDYDAIDYSDNTGETYFDYRHPELQEYPDGTINIGGIPTAKSSVNLPGKGSRFYKAVGIGGPYGPFGFNAQIQGYGGYIVSMDFHYKGEVLHFDY